jgi:hypothetical protein
MWHSIEDWNNWKTNPSRSEFMGEMEKIMVGPEEMEAYAMGMKTDARSLSGNNSPDH